VAQNPKAVFVTTDDGFLGTVSANLIGSKYQIFNQVQNYSIYSTLCAVQLHFGIKHSFAARYTPVWLAALRSVSK
jgi:hypothetical protein